MYAPSGRCFPSSLPLAHFPRCRQSSAPRSSPSLLRLRFARATSGSDPGSASTSGGGGGDELAGIAGRQVDELLRREENKPLLDGLQAASRRVQLARQALEDIERQEDEVSRAKAMIRHLQNQESQIAESQKDLLEARALVNEAERSLSSNIDKNRPNFLLEDYAEDIDRDAERSESLKAAVISSLAGTLAALPFSFYLATGNLQLIQDLIIVAISCFLFGATFRYAIRRDLNNINLKTGTSTAFGVVKGFAALESAKLFDFNTINFPEVFDMAVHLSENILIFTFSAIALDFCFKMGLVSPFPIRK